MYLYDGKSDWWLNGKHCKSGYIILARSKDIEHIKSNVGQVHGKVYKSLFGIEPDTEKVIGSGFAYYNGQWKFNSFIFNTVSDGYHSDDNSMNTVEKEWVMKAMRNWIENGQKNTKVESKTPLVLQEH